MWTVILYRRCAFIGYPPQQGWCDDLLATPRMKDFVQPGAMAPAVDPKVGHDPNDPYVELGL